MRKISETYRELIHDTVKTRSEWIQNMFRRVQLSMINIHTGSNMVKRILLTYLLTILAYKRA